MKTSFKTLLSIVLFFISMSFTYNATAQTLEINEVDDFTGSSVKRTSWETFNNSFAFTGYFRFSEIDKNYTFDLKMLINNSIFSINEGAELIFKLQNGELITLNNSAFTIACQGCAAKGSIGYGSYGVSTYYLITNDQIKQLKTSDVVKVRIYTNDGYVEDDIKSKHAQKISNALSIIE